jgi:hypothetical protein
MKRVKCEHCETEFEPKNSWQKFCKRGCNRRAYRQRKGLPEPDFPSMKVDSFVERERQIRKKEDAEILELVEELKGLEEIRTFRQALNDKPTDWKVRKYLGEGGQLVSTIGQAAAHLFSDKSVGLNDRINEMNRQNEMLANNHFAALLNDTMGKMEVVRRKIEGIREKQALRQSKQSLDGMRQQLGDARIFRKLQSSIPFVDVLDSEDGVSSVNLGDIKNYKFDSISIPNYEWLGKLERGAIIMLHGGAGSGKSTFALKLANSYMAGMHGKAMYVAAEEMKTIGGKGIPSQTLVDRIKRYSIGENIAFTSNRTLGGIIKSAKDNNAGFIVIDSLSATELSTDDIKKMIHLMPGVIIVFILQHTKQGTYKGDSELDHLSDMTIRAEKFKLSTVKTRYGQFENVGI